MVGLSQVVPIPSHTLAWTLFQPQLPAQARKQPFQHFLTRTHSQTWVEARFCPQSLAVWGKDSSSTLICGETGRLQVGALERVFKAKETAQARSRGIRSWRWLQRRVEGGWKPAGMRLSPSRPCGRDPWHPSSSQGPQT